jgi:hypothetical protein
MGCSNSTAAAGEKKRGMNPHRQSRRGLARKRFATAHNAKEVSGSGTSLYPPSSADSASNPLHRKGRTSASVSWSFSSTGIVSGEAPPEVQRTQARTPDEPTPRPLVQSPSGSFSDVSTLIEFRLDEVDEQRPTTGQLDAQPVSALEAACLKEPLPLPLPVILQGSASAPEMSQFQTDDSQPQHGRVPAGPANASRGYTSLEYLATGMTLFASGS